MVDFNNVFNVATANDVIATSKDEKEPCKLWDEFWYEHEICCLFADANAGKSILAVQIANDIAKNLKENESVLYYDFELSKKQFSLRYMNNGEPYNFPTNFLRVDINIRDTDSICANNQISFEDLIINGIESNINQYNGKVVIIDNISWLTNMKDSTTTAGLLMKRLCSLKQTYNISILVLAHTPKRDLKKPLTQNSLSGSKKFTNFFDAMFAIGVSAVDPSIRYVKQIKVRTGEFKYDASHVKLYTINRQGNFLGFMYKGISTEDKQLHTASRRSSQSNERTKTKRQMMGVTAQFIENLAKNRVQRVYK